MFDLPQSFLILPNPKSNAFSKTLRKTHLFYIRHLLTCSLSELPREYQTSIHQLRLVLTRILRENPEQLIKAISRQDIFSALILLRNKQGDPLSLWTQLLTTLFFQLQTLPEDFLWAHPIKQIILHDEIILFQEPIQNLSIGPLGISGQTLTGHILPWEDLKKEGKRTHPFTSLHRNIQFSLFDANPFAMDEAHPDKEGNALQLGGYSVEHWCSVLTESMNLIQNHVPEWWSECTLYMNRIVPVGFDSQKHLSASYAESPGLAYLSLHPNLLTMAEAFIHEAQHSKINLVRLLDPMIHNGFSEWTTSPVRPDIRPLHGLLLAAHAFIPVAAFHYRLKQAKHPISRTPEFEYRRQEVLKSNANAIKHVKEKAQPTKLGASLIRGLEALHIATSSN